MVVEMCCIADLETVLSKNEAELRWKYKKNDGLTTEDKKVINEVRDILSSLEELK